MRKGAPSVTTSARIIPIDEARASRDARRRSLSADARVSAEDMAKLQARAQAKEAKAEARAQAKEAKAEARAQVKQDKFQAKVAKAEMQIAAAVAEQEAARYAAAHPQRTSVKASDRVSKPPKHLVTPEESAAQTERRQAKEAQKAQREATKEARALARAEREQAKETRAQEKAAKAEAKATAKAAAAQVKTSVAATSRVSAEDAARASAKTKAKAKSAAFAAAINGAGSRGAAGAGRSRIAGFFAKVRASVRNLLNRGRRNAAMTAIEAAQEAAAQADAHAAAIAADPKASAHEKAQARVQAAKAKTAAAKEQRTAVARISRTYVIREKLNNLLARPLMASAALFCTLIVLVGIFLYPTARTYYQSIREEARLEAEFNAVLDRNKKMAADITFLQTDDGIIQEARETLGWVQRGENAVIVYGIEYKDEADLDADIVAGTVKAPTTWYSPFLDFIFGVK